MAANNNTDKSAEEIKEAAMAIIGNFKLLNQELADLKQRVKRLEESK